MLVQEAIPETYTLGNAELLSTSRKRQFTIRMRQSRHSSRTDEKRHLHILAKNARPSINVPDVPQ